MRQTGHLEHVKGLYRTRPTPRPSLQTQTMLTDLTAPDLLTDALCFLKDFFDV